MSAQPTKRKRSGEYPELDVSVIIPCYNSAEFVGNAVKSALFQKEVNLEVIAIDDGSADHTVTVLKRLQEQFPQLIVIEIGNNRGQATARNTGILASRGRWISFLDSDDFYSSHMALSRAIGALKGDQADVIYAGRKTITGLTSRVETKFELDANAIAGASCWQLMVNRRFLQANKILFNVSTPQREDFPFAFEVLTSAKSVVMHPEPMIVHVRRSGSTMHSFPGPKQVEYFSIHMELVGDLMRQPQCHDGLKIALAKKYLKRTMVYWADPIAKMLPEKKPRADKVASRFLAALFLVSNIAGPLNNQETPLGLKREAVRWDLLRLVAESGNLAYFQMFISGERFHYRELALLDAQSTCEWSTRTVADYLRFFGSREQDVPMGTLAPLNGLVRRVVLHLGYPKTGTSSLQLWLEGNRFKLLDEGIWYPITGVSNGFGMREDRTAGHTSLLRKLSWRATSSNAMKALTSEIFHLGKPVDTLFLSSEMILSHHFWSHQGRKSRGHILLRLKEALGVDDIDVLVVVRPPLDWLERYYQEVISNPFNRYTPSFVSFAKMIKRKGLLDFAGIRDFLVRSFPRGAVSFNSYEDVVAQGGLITFVANQQLSIGSKDLLNAPQPVANQGLSGAQSYVIREAKKLVESKPVLEEIYKEVLESQELRVNPLPLVTEAEMSQAAKILGKESEGFRRMFPESNSSPVRRGGRFPLPDFEPLEKLRRDSMMARVGLSSFNISRVWNVVTRLQRLRGSGRLRRKARSLANLVFFLNQKLYVQHFVARQISSGGWRFSN